MFKNTTNRNRIILFISSYFPMYLIIIIQNASSFINNVQNRLEQKSIAILEVINSKHMVLYALKTVFGFVEFYVILFFVTLSIMSFLLLKKMLNGLKDYEDEAFQLKVTSIKNVNYQYVITYFSTYIFPFITVNLSTIAGILQFSVLWGLIGYIYVKNNLVFINPTLNIFFKYNIYETDMEYQDEGEIISFTAILLSKKDRNSIKKVQVIKESEGFYIES